MSATDVVHDLLVSLLGWLVGPYALVFTVTALVLVAVFIAYDSGKAVGADSPDGPIEVK